MTNKTNTIKLLPPELTVPPKDSATPNNTIIKIIKPKETANKFMQTIHLTIKFQPFNHILKKKLKK